MSVSCAHTAHPPRPGEVFSLGKPAGAEGLSLRNKAFREVECLWLGNCSWQKVQCEAGGEKLKLLVFVPLAWGRAQCPVLPCPIPGSQKFILGTKQTRQSYPKLVAYLWTGSLMNRTFPWDSNDPAEPPCIPPDRREFQLQSPPSLQVPSLPHPLPWVVAVFNGPFRTSRSVPLCHENKDARP